ncbi:hypothetical protein OEZ86_009424 [Tetradesmus obliquus]|nr:hypothetical protein OEZ86_009424 [Tetradesmus obliquus]
MSKPRRNRKQMCPQRAPMYSNTGAVTPDTEDYHQHNSCDRGHRPPRTHRNPISHVAAAAAAVTAKVSRATHSTAAARSSGGNAKKSANPCSGPCDNCGARDSPQWRHGSKSKPIVCNACGIRFLRTGSFDKAVDKKRCAATSSVVSGGARLPKRSRADDSSSMEEDEDEQEDEPHMASRSCAHPAASDGGIHSCADSKAAAGGRRVTTPAPEDNCGGQQQQHDYAMSPAVSSASAYSDGAGPCPLSLGPAATPSSAGGSSRDRAVTSSGNSAGRGGQQPGQLRGVVRGPNGRFMSRHGMSPLSNASSGGGASKPSS